MNKATQYLGTPLHPRRGRWSEGAGDLAATWYCYDERGLYGVVYARPYHDRRGCVRWQMHLRIPPQRPPSADELRAAHEVRQRLNGARRPI